jgi:predicted esterase
MDHASEFGEFRSRVLASYQRGDYGSTLRLALRALDRFPEHRAEATFWAACMRSVMGDPEAAVRVLRDGLADGMWWAPTRLQDSDLDDAREIAEFADLSFESKRRWAAACQQIQPTVRLHSPVGVFGPLLIVLHGWTADDLDMEQLWMGAVDAGVTVAYLRSSQPDTSDRMRFYWGDAEHTSRDVQRGIEIARERLGPNLGPLLLGAFSAGGRLALEVAFRREAAAHAVISIGAALPPDLRDFPVAEGVASDVRTWLLVGEDDPFRQANEALHALLQRQLGACRLTVVPRLGHDLPHDLPDRLHEAVSFALGESQ